MGCTLSRHFNFHSLKRPPRLFRGVLTGNLNIVMHLRYSVNPFHQLLIEHTFQGLKMCEIWGVGSFKTEMASAAAHSSFSVWRAAAHSRFYMYTVCYLKRDSMFCGEVNAKLEQRGQGFVSSAPVPFLIRHFTKKLKVFMIHHVLSQVIHMTVCSVT